MPAHEVDDEVVRRFRAGEQIEGMHRERLVLLTTTGRRTGHPRTSPMMAVDHHGEPMVVASAAGATRHPAWFLNLRDDPRVVVETPDGAARSAIAEVLSGEGRAATWAALVATLPFLAEHQQRAGDREIPLVVLHPAGA